MILRADSKYTWLLALSAAFLMAVGVKFAYCAETSPEKKIIILPFYIPPGNGDSELREFRDHVNKRVRSSIELLGHAFALESQENTEKLLDGRSAVEDDQEAQQIGKNSGADLVIYGALSTTGPLFHMRGVVWDLAKGREMVATDVKVGNIHALPGVLELFISTINMRLLGSPTLPLYKTEPGTGTGLAGLGRPQSLLAIPRDTGPWRSPEIATPLWGMAIGDLDGDGRNESVFLGETGITIGRVERGNLTTLAHLSQAPVRYISAEVADIDGDGLAELIVTYLTPVGIESAIVKYKNRVFEVSEKFPDFILRTVSESVGDEKVLVGQRTDVSDLFSGEMVRFRHVDGRITPGGSVRMPPGTLILSQTAGELGKNKDFLRVILNQDQRLMIFDKDNQLLAQVSDRIYGLDRRMRIPSPTGYRDVVFPGTLIIADTDGDGENELLTIKESNGGSYVQALVWDGSQLVEKWKTVRTPGLISDFRIGDLKNEQNRSLVLILLKPTPFPALTSPRSIIYAYDLMP
jgi:hypothetical protein